MEAETKYNFTASQEDELSFEKGTIINVSTVELQETTSSI